MSRWTTADIPALSGMTAVVTGANSGLGFQVAVELARAGARVVLACRSERTGGEAVLRLKGQVPPADVTLGSLDLASLASVADFAECYLGEHRSLDLLVNNAGVMAIPYARTADGFEMQFGTNHLGHFALTGRLLPALLTGRASRVVTVSSFAHRMGRIDFSDLHAERHYQKWTAYGSSKLANLLFSYELQRRAEAAGAALRALAAHPGYAATNLQSRGPQLAGSRVSEVGAALGNRLFGQSAAAGALPTLRAATEPDAAGGTFFGPGGPLQMRGHPKPVQSSSAAHDPEVARRLWAASEELTGVRYDFSPAAVADPGPA